MRKFWSSSAVLCGVTVLGFMLAAGQNQAEARPQYLKEFLAKYPDVAEAKTVKCGVCHPDKDKKVRNDYGKAMGKGLGDKNQKDTDKIGSAMTEAEKEKSGVDGKTFGDLLKDGKLPSSAE